MLVQCWPTFSDYNPTFGVSKEYGVSYFLSSCEVVSPITNKHSSSINAGLMLGQRRRQWPNIKPALFVRSVLPGLGVCVWGGGGGVRVSVVVYVFWQCALCWWRCM